MSTQGWYWDGGPTSSFPRESVWDGGLGDDSRGRSPRKEERFLRGTRDHRPTAHPSP